MAFVDGLRDLDLKALVKTFPTATATGADTLLKRLEAPTADASVIAHRQQELQTIRARLKTTADSVTRCLATLKETETDVISVAEADVDKRFTEYYTQILWPRGSLFSRLNHLGWLTEIIVFLRTILLPGLSVIMPLFVFVAPLVFYHVVLKQRITPSQYLTMLSQSIKKAMPSVLGKPRFAGRGGVAETGEQFVHIAASVGMFGFSIWNQVSAAFNMRKVVTDMRQRAGAVVRFTEAVQELGAALGVPVNVGRAWSVGAMGTFGDAWNEPERVRQVLRVAGELDMLATLAGLKRICFPQYCESSEGIVLRDIYHPGIPRAQRVYNSVELKNNQHILLTGPNRGGKSTLLKTVGLTVLMAQTIGVVFARKATLPVFDSIIMALSPTDTLGKMSLFEAEIEFAKSVKSRLATDGGPMFLMMDEIFHGTNAHDGVAASQVFLDDLYATPDARVYSVVSTHYMDLPERYGGDKTLNLCMDASQHPTNPDALTYTYRLTPGINRFSSVREILFERGLLVRSDPGKNTASSE